MPGGAEQLSGARLLRRDTCSWVLRALLALRTALLLLPGRLEEQAAAADLGLLRVGGGRGDGLDPRVAHAACRQIALKALILGIELRPQHPRQAALLARGGVSRLVLELGLALVGPHPVAVITVEAAPGAVAAVRRGGRGGQRRPLGLALGLLCRRLLGGEGGGTRQGSLRRRRLLERLLRLSDDGGLDPSRTRRLDRLERRGAVGSLVGGRGELPLRAAGGARRQRAGARQRPQLGALGVDEAREHGGGEG
eukprot:scaffold117154_cov48-Phaeocystis_antarctica.AAC.2